MLPVAGHAPPTATPSEVTPWPSVMGVPWLVWRPGPVSVPTATTGLRGPSVSTASKLLRLPTARRVLVEPLAVPVTR